MRYLKLQLPLLALALAAGGCGAGGRPGGSASATPAPGSNWIVVEGGSATPSPSVTYGGSRSPALPPVSFLPVDPTCAREWTVEPVLIPLEVTPGAGKLTVTWPRQYGSTYRITAVKQTLKAGTQDPYTWQNVSAGTGCTVTATIGGLASGVPYVVWLDAPGTGYERDGQRHPYSGRSGVVYPR
ncbi:hypothetical protein [Pseudosporangium ferrugineum]|uniref:Fibronectin type-III domain-containing protein n=1 Tax=Pseudosporangium ferrugineum TaxID=439699 RepID=A0A2T0S7Y2_9ACTN|nr:hypothetical protein [Pseudosporangium ferrugineum]PRY29526.1 hypothetical protein CLV70_106247 [Pseudosporangium ferrugineum]